METVLVYTFRTSNHLGLFKSKSIPVFVFGKLKEDLEEFKKLILSKKPKVIIGLAEVPTPSRIEALAVNSFGKNKRITKNGRLQYQLVSPKGFVFPVSKNVTNSFCNWTAYKISEFLTDNSIHNSFIHFNTKDLERIVSLLK